MRLQTWLLWFSTPKRQAALLAWLAFLAVLLTLGDPGITIDEPLDVSVGRRYLLQADRYLGLYTGALQGQPSRLDADRLFRDNAQHPPLGRLLLGLASILAEPAEQWLGGADTFSVHPARLAPAVGFSLLVGLITLAASRTGGPVAGLVAGFSLLAMPRLFAHAHFATLDTLLCLFWVAALLAAEHALRQQSRPALRLSIAGALWGLALLLKIHAWLLAPLIVVRVFMKLGLARGLRATLAWAVSGLAVFFIGWPWLWFDTLQRLQTYLLTSVDRLALRVQYFGRVYLDHDVPWHYPWFYFLVTVPLGLHLLGAVGARRAWKGRSRDDLPLVLLLTTLAWLILFSTNAPVYDGERLFLVAFPLWAPLIGLGFQSLWTKTRLLSVRALLVLFLAVQGYGLVTIHPFGLSFYSLAVGGLPGAEKLGLELTYWGDAITTDLLDGLARRARPRQTVALVPSLHHIQPASLQTKNLLDRSLNIQEQAAYNSADWLLVYRRTAYWPPQLEAELKRCRPVFLNRRQGVWLSGLWLRPGVRFAALASPPLTDSSLPPLPTDVELSGRITTIFSE